MHYCADCSSSLALEQDALGQHWRCPICGGRAAQLAEFLSCAHRALTESVRLEKTSGPPCPSCAERMEKVNLSGDPAIPAAVCPQCDVLWLDNRSVKALLPPPEPVLPPPVEEELTPEARTALLMIEMDNKLRESRETWEPLDELWKKVLAFMGYPVETDVPSTRQSTPWVTWSLAAVVTLVSLIALYGAQGMVDALGFIPSKALRYGGLTFFTAFFLHGGWFHLLGNMYALLVFGKSVERHLGSARYAMLLGLATMVGSFTHFLGNPHDTMPCIGASGGIAGIMLAYAFFFPRARFALCLVIGVFIRWVRLRAYALIILWLLQQLLVASLQLAGRTSVSGLAHLGGAIAGLLCWYLWRESAGVASGETPIPDLERAGVSDK